MKNVIPLFLLLFGFISKLSSQQTFFRFFDLEKDGLISSLSVLNNKGYVVNVIEAKNSTNPSISSKFYILDSTAQVIKIIPQFDNLYYNIEKYKNNYIGIGYSLNEWNKLVITWFDSNFEVVSEKGYYLVDDRLLFSKIYSTLNDDSTLLVSGYRFYIDPTLPKFDYPYILKLDLKNDDKYIGNDSTSNNWSTIFLDSKEVKDTVFLFEKNGAILKYSKDLKFLGVKSNIYLTTSQKSWHIGTGEIISLKNYLFISGRRTYDDYKPRDKISMLRYNLSKGTIDKSLEISNSNNFHYNGGYKSISSIEKNKIFVIGWDNFGLIPSVNFPNDSSHIILAQVDSNLNLRWQRQYGGDAYYMALGVEALDDGGCLAYGSRYQPGGELKRQGFLLKVNENGELTSVFGPTPKEIISLQPFPNPATTDLAWQLPSDVFKDEIELQLFNSLGQLVKLERFQSTSDVLKTSITNLPSGVYNWKISDNKHEAKGSVVVVR